MSSETQLTVSQLVVYPIKSCAGIEVERLEFDEVGPLHDRRYMVVNPDGRFLTQRQLPVMARIIPELTETGITLTLSGQTALPACAVQQPEHGSWSEAQVSLLQALLNRCPSHDDRDESAGAVVQIGFEAFLQMAKHLEDEQQRRQGETTFFGKIYQQFVSSNNLAAMAADSS